MYFKHEILFDIDSTRIWRTGFIEVESATVSAGQENFSNCGKLTVKQNICFIKIIGIKFITIYYQFINNGFTLKQVLGFVYCTASNLIKLKV